VRVTGLEPARSPTRT